MCPLGPVEVVAKSLPTRLGALRTRSMALTGKGTRVCLWALVGWNSYPVQCRQRILKSILTVYKYIDC